VQDFYRSGALVQKIRKINDAFLLNFFNLSVGIEVIGSYLKSRGFNGRAGTIPALV